MSNTACIPTFRHLGLMASKHHPYESDNFEACSVRHLCSDQAHHAEIYSLKALTVYWKLPPGFPAENVLVKVVGWGCHQTRGRVALVTVWNEREKTGQSNTVDVARLNYVLTTRLRQQACVT